MSIVSGILYGSNWEPIPWSAGWIESHRQNKGFRARAQKPIKWTRLWPYNFPDETLFGHSKDWFLSHNAEFFAVEDNEELLLTQNIWFGWPDPPEWGLMSRLAGEEGNVWKYWGHFVDIPKMWKVPFDSKLATSKQD